MMDEYDRYAARLRRLRAAYRVYNRMIITLVLMLMVLLGLAIYDMYRYTYAGAGTCEYHDFATLKETNPDVCAWLTMDNTTIDYPVVQGKDNFEYLDKDFYGKTSAAGSIFLDSGNSKDLSDRYNVIHGHHMEHGVMFGALDSYRDREFFGRSSTGTLLTEKSVFALTVVGAGTFDAYDTEVYAVSGAREMPLELLDRCELKREAPFGEDDRLLALSTCSGDMSNDRIVVLCRMRYMGPNDR